MNKRDLWEKAGYDWPAHDEREKEFLDKLSSAKSFDKRIAVSFDYFTKEHAIALSSGISKNDPNLHSPEFLMRMQAEST